MTCGIGDDCAILKTPAGYELLVTTDLCIEDVHFRREWHPAVSVGHRCLTRGLSDIAAMGGEPMACFLSLGLPATVAQKWVDGFLRGLLALADLHHVTLAGGDIASAEKITADIVVLGKVKQGQALMRSGARAGDRIFVTGTLGGSAATLQTFYAGKSVDSKSAKDHFYPQPQLEPAGWLRKKKLASAAIDLSDGLSVDLGHLCEESNVAALIDGRTLPLASNATLDLALHGGDDYQLLFTAAPKARVPNKIAGIPVTLIGEIRRNSESGTQLLFKGSDGKIRPLKPQGWEHFRKI